MTRKVSFQLSAAALLAIAFGDARTPGIAAQASAGQAPTYQVDPLWPQPLRAPWILGSVTGIAVDARDHVWLVHRGMASLTARTEAGLATDPPTAETCCAPAPPVLEFDPAGALVGHWGGPGQGYDWPQSPGGMAVDGRGNVWITAGGMPAPARDAAQAAPPPPQDAHVLKFSRTGAFLLQIGKPGDTGDGASRTGLNRPVDVDVDTQANEVYIADGGGNNRVVVFDATTGAYKRHWPLTNASCVRIARDGLVYGCDRKNNRVQVSRKDGTVVSEAVIAKGTLGEGAVWDIAFSRDPQQQVLFVADGSNQKVWVLRRETLAVISSVGGGGRWPGHFYGVGSVAVDSRGNLYTGETYEGKRLQRFISTSMGTAEGARK